MLIIWSHIFHIYSNKKNYVKKNLKNIFKKFNHKSNIYFINVYTSFHIYISIYIKTNSLFFHQI